MFKIDELTKDDLIGKTINEINKEFSLTKENEEVLLDKISSYDLTICFNCKTVVDSCDYARYEGIDFVFTNLKEDDETYSECCFCDDCIELNLETNIKLI